LRGFTKIARDITEKKKLEDELVTAREHLEDVVMERTAKLRDTISELEVFSYSLSHDLRTPLRAMQSFAYILAETLKGKLDERSANYLERIVAGSERLDRLIQDVLTYSRVARGQVRLETVELERLVEEIIQEQPLLDPAKAEISMEKPLSNVCAHKALLSQCIANLLNNAVKFVEPGTFPRVRVRTEARNDYVRLWVEDNGIGVGKEYQERIFGMFQRGGHEKEYEGTGIGLAIVRKAMERMGGQAGVESEIGQGSRFWLELPGEKPE